MRCRPATSVASTTPSQSKSTPESQCTRRRGSVVTAVDRYAGVELRAPRLQILAQRIPQGDIEVGVRDVEDQALAGAEEVDVEHGGQLGRGQRAGFGEEAAGEHLERQMPCGVGEVDGTQEAVGVEVVEPLVDAGHRHRGQRRGRAGVEPDQVAQPERRAAQCERQRVQRRRLRKAAERVAPALPVDQRVVLDSGEHAQPGIDAAQQVPQVVVLPEERVEAAVHRQVGAVVGLLGPAADASAEVGLPLDDVDGDAALDQPGRRGQPGDAAAHHDDVRCAAQRACVGQAGRCRVAGAAADRSSRRFREEGVHDVALPARTRSRCARWRSRWPAAGSGTPPPRRNRSRCAAGSGRGRRHRCAAGPSG